jgi:flavin reductase (DIM6/NTAB) family NADH-FMN oxidoreductase RutF
VVSRTGRFTLNVISKSNHDLMKRFSRYSPDQFNNLAYVSTYCGLLLKDAVASLDCVVKTSADAGDHQVVIAEVVNGGLLNRELEPMTHVRQSGFNY